MTSPEFRLPGRLRVLPTGADWSTHPEDTRDAELADAIRELALALAKFANVLDGGAS